MASSVQGGDASTLIERKMDEYIYVFDRRKQGNEEKRIHIDDISDLHHLNSIVKELFSISRNDQYVISTTNREEIKNEDDWKHIEAGDTLYVLEDIDQELVAPTKERVSYLPHYDTIVKGGMYEYYASEGQNPLPYAFAELIDNALAATAQNDGSRYIEIKLHLDEKYPGNNVIFVTDNGKGMTSRQLNNWAVYRLSKFIRTEKRGKLPNLEGESTSETPNAWSNNAPRSLNSDISYFGVGGKQAIFFVGSATRMISKPADSKDVHELTISQEEFQEKEKNRDAIYSGFIRNRKAGDSSHVASEEEILRQVIAEEEDKGSFTTVVINNINPTHVNYLKHSMDVWTRHLAHIYHYYIHGPNGNFASDNTNGDKACNPFNNIDIVVKLYPGGGKAPKVVKLRDITDDMQTQYIRTAANTFEFKATLEGTGIVEGILRYHPFLYDKETFPSDANDPRADQEDDEPDYNQVNDIRPARGKRPIYECYWNGRLIPYTSIDDFEWCSAPKKTKVVPVECYNRISGVLWTNDKFQVSTNKLTFIDLEMKLRDKNTAYTRILGKNEKRTDIGKEFLQWLKECHEKCDKQIKFSQFDGHINRLDLPKKIQGPWGVFKQIEWDGKVYKAGTMVRIIKTLPFVYGTVKRFLLFGEYDGDVYATGGEVEVVQEPTILYDDIKIFPLTKLDRQCGQDVIDKYIDDEEGKLPEKLLVSWPEGNEVTEGERRKAGQVVGAIKVEIANRRNEMISKLPGSTQRKLLIELKVIWHGAKRNEVIAQHISQHGKNWPYWFRKMTNVKNLGDYTISVQTMLNESGCNTFAGKVLPTQNIKFSIVEGEADRFTIGSMEGPFKVGEPFNIPIEFQDEFGHQTKPIAGLKPTLEANGLDLDFADTAIKGKHLLIKGVVASGEIPSAAGKSFNILVKVATLPSGANSVKVRLLPGVPDCLAVFPETEEINVENGKSLKLDVELRDRAGNLTGSAQKLLVVCKFSGASEDLPTYTLDVAGSGKGCLTGLPISLKKLPANKGEQITAKIEVQNHKSIPACTRCILVTPSSRASCLEVRYTDISGNTQCALRPGQDVYATCGEFLQGITFLVKDEAGRTKQLDKDFVDKMKVNWTPKLSSDELVKGHLPDIKVPNLLTDSKYCHISVADGTGLEFSFVLKGIVGGAAKLNCKCPGSTKVRMCQKMESDILVTVHDKHGNELKKLDRGALEDLQCFGEGLVAIEVIKNLGQPSGFVIKNVSFIAGRLGSREICVRWRNLREYVRLEVVPGAPARLLIPNWDLAQPLVVYNETRLRQLFLVQLCDDAGNNVAEANVKVQLARDPGIKLLPVPAPVRTNKSGIADFGHLTVQGPRGVYEIQPKAFVSTRVTISGPKVKISIQPDLTKPVRIDVLYDKKQPVMVGDHLPDFTARVYAEDDQPIQFAKSSCICLKIWRPPSTVNKPQHRYGPEQQKKSEKEAAQFLFSRKAPTVAGMSFLQIFYSEGKNEVNSELIKLEILPGVPTSLVPTETPGVPTVSNTKSMTTRTLIRQLQVQLMDKYNNSAGGEINGKLKMEIVNMSARSSTEIPFFVGNTHTIMGTFTEGKGQLQNLVIAENSQGKDGQQYILRCTIESKKLTKDAAIPPLDIPFLFYNDMKKHAQMAALTKERDNLKSAIKTYKSLFDTTQQLIDELKISLNEAKAEEDMLRLELRKLNVPSSQIANVSSVESLLTVRQREREQLKTLPRRMCGLQPAPKHPEVLGKIAQLAEVQEPDIARVLSWHMSADMDCVVTLSTRKAKDIYNQSGGKQQVLPLDSIFKKNLPDWNKPLPHFRIRANWNPRGNPVYARNMLIFPANESDCRIVFGMLLGDTIILDTLDDANAYRQEIVKHTHCPTILTREGDRIRSNGKFGGLMNKALPLEKLRGAVFAEPLPKRFQTICSQIDLLENFKSSLEKRLTAEEELTEQRANQNTAEMKAKYKECTEAEAQLRDIEDRLGLTAKRGQPDLIPEDTPSSASPSPPAPVVTPTPPKRGRPPATPIADKTFSPPPTKRGRPPATVNGSSEKKAAAAVEESAPAAPAESPITGTRSGRMSRKSAVFDPSPELGGRKRTRRT